MEDRQVKKQRIIEQLKTLQRCPRKCNLLDLDISIQDIIDAYTPEVEASGEESRDKQFAIALGYAQFDAGYLGKYTVREVREAYEKKYAEVFHETFAERKNPNRTLTIIQFQPYSQILIRQFGSWNAGLKALGYAAEAKTMTKEKMIAMLQEKAEKLGRSPTKKELGDYGYFICQTLGNGNWSAAMRAAGLNPVRDYTEDELLDIIRSKAQELGHCPTAYDVAESVTIQRHIGPWSFAVAKALKGGEFECYYIPAPRRRTVGLTPEQMWKEIWELKVKLGRDPKHFEYAHAGAAMQRCGGLWRTALEKADEYGRTHSDTAGCGEASDKDSTE